MTTARSQAPGDEARSGEQRRRRPDPVVPEQHGAWGFLALPVLLGSAAGGWSEALLPVAAAWIAAYPLSWAVSGRLTAPRRAERFDRAVRTWAVVAAPLMLASVVLRPWLVWVGLAYLVPFTVNLAFARARRERDLANDLVLVAECAAAVPVVAGVVTNSSAWTLPWSAMTTTDVGLAVLLCVLTLVGSTLHVKSLIRERHNPRFALASRLFALAAVPVVLGTALAAGRSGWLCAPFVLLALRGFLVRDRGWRPARIGMIELACFVGVAATALVVLG